MQANILCQYCIYRASGEEFSAFLLQLRKDVQAFKLWILGHMGHMGCKPAISVAAAQMETPPMALPRRLLGDKILGDASA
jgi:hypothetical protein